MEKEKIISAIRQRVQEDRIACAVCFKIAEEFDIPKKKLGEILNEIGVKVIQCQLGLFR